MFSLNLSLSLTIFDQSEFQVEGVKEAPLERSWDTNPWRNAWHGVEKKRGSQKRWSIWWEMINFDLCFFFINKYIVMWKTRNN